MANQKMLRGYVTITAYDPEAFANLAAPTVAELNAAAFRYNISCAITDDYTLNMSDSDTDDSRSICDVGQVETPTFFNYEASLDAFRDLDTNAAGLFNLFRDLFRAPDVPYILVKRIGKANTELFAVGDVVSLFSVNTDYPVDTIEDNSPLLFGARFKPTGGINVNYKVVA